MGKLLRIGMLGLVGIGVTATAASAQTTAIGYGFVSPAFATYEGDSLAIFQGGGGGEARLGQAFGLGADLGYAAPWEAFSDSVGTLSVNGTYYVKGTNRGRRLQPFATGGYTLLFKDGTVNGVNVGVGVDRWMRDRVGMRFEFRDNIMMQEGESFHLWGPRLSIIWRGK